MLSKVLSRRDADGIQPMILASVDIHGTEAPLRKEAAADNALERDNEALRGRVRQLEAELTAGKREQFEAGRRQGEQQARSEMAPVIERVAASLSELSGLRQEMRSKAERDMVQLSLLIAKRILHRELNVDPNALSALARVVFERLVRSEAWHVTVHPRFATSLTAAMGPGQASRMRIEPDPECSLGTFIVRSEEGKIDASVDAQLEEIARGLADRIGGRTS